MARGCPSCLLLAWPCPAAWRWGMRGALVPLLSCHQVADAVLSLSPSSAGRLLLAQGLACCLLPLALPLGCRGRGEWELEAPR